MNREKAARSGHNLKKPENNPSYPSRIFEFAPIIYNTPLNGKNYKEILKNIGPFLDNDYEEWKKDGFAQKGRFPLELGMIDRTEFDKPFGFWYMHLGIERQFSSPDYESKVASILITWCLDKITKTKPNNFQELGGLLTTLQLISTNLHFSPNNIYDRTFHGNSEGGQGQSLPMLPSMLLHEMRLNSSTRENNNDVFNLYYSHIEAWQSGVESGRQVPANLLDAFFGLMKEFGELYYYDFTNFKYNPLESTRASRRRLPEIVQFGRRYVQGLIVVADKMATGHHNGVLYLTDHLEKILEGQGLMPEKGEVISAVEWRERLLSSLKDPKLFDFFSHDNKVREIAGRYDYRALADFFKNDKRSHIDMVPLGFGTLGVATYELDQLLRSLRIKTNIFPFDLLGVKNLPVFAKNKYSVNQMLRVDGVFSHIHHPFLPDFRQWTDDEIRKELVWRQNMLYHSPMSGHKLDLRYRIPPISKAGLVTLQGTVGCVDNFKDRVAMIENSLRIVNQENGIFLLEGGMTLQGGQNINAICFRFNNGRIEPLYLNISGQRENVAVDYNAQKRRLIAFDQKLTQRSQRGTNYFGIPFNKAQIIETIYQAIGNNLN